MENFYSRKEFENSENENININDVNSQNNSVDKEMLEFESELQDKSIIDLESMKTTYEKNIILRREKLEEFFHICLEHNNGNIYNKKTGKRIPLTETLKRQLVEQNEKNIYEEFGKKLGIVNGVLGEKINQNIAEINKEIRCLNMDLNRIMAGNVIKNYDYMKAKYITDRLKAKQAQVRILKTLNKNYYRYYVTEDKVTKQKRVYMAAEKAYEKQQKFYNPYLFRQEQEQQEKEQQARQQQKKVIIPDLRNDEENIQDDYYDEETYNNANEYGVVIRSGFVNVNIGKGISKYRFETNRAKAIQMIYDEISTNRIDEQGIFTKDDAERLINGLDIKAVDPNVVLALIKYEKERIDLKNIDKFDEYTQLRKRILKDISCYYMQVKSGRPSSKLRIIYDLKASNNMVNEKYFPLKEQAFRSKAFATVKTGFLDKITWFFKRQKETEMPERKYKVHFVKEGSFDYYVKGSNRIKIRNSYDRDEYEYENENEDIYQDEIKIQTIDEVEKEEKEYREEQLRKQQEKEKEEFEKAKADVVIEAYKVKKDRADGNYYDDRI